MPPVSETLCRIYVEIRPTQIVAAPEEHTLPTEKKLEGIQGAIQDYLLIGLCLVEAADYMKAGGKGKLILYDKQVIVLLHFIFSFTAA